MTARPAAAEAREGFTLAVRPGEEATLAADLVWPEPDGRTRLHVTGTMIESGAGAPAVQLELRAAAPDGTVAHARRTIAVDQGGATILEVGRRRRATLVFAVTAALEREPRLAAPPVPGSPCLLVLEIQRLRGDEALTLETNQLATFVGEPVSYAFRLGDTGVGDALEVRLEPRRLIGDIAEIEIQVTGTLPDAEQLVAISRREQWHMSRGAASELSIEVGEPPVGYRFKVTPYF
jgi:hypothetical protein